MIANDLYEPITSVVGRQAKHCKIRGCETGNRASRSAKSIITARVFDSADLWDAMHTNIFPRTFSAG